MQEWYSKHIDACSQVQKEAAGQHQNWFQFCHQMAWIQWLNWQAHLANQNYRNFYDNQTQFEVLSSPVNAYLQNNCETQDTNRCRQDSRYHSEQEESNYRQQKQEFATDCESYVEASDTEDTYTELEMEITEEMKEFFAISEKHRQERDAERQRVMDQENKLTAQQYVLAEDVSSLHIQGTILPPREQPGARRKTEMKELYGDGSAMIQAMETAMQLAFDRGCDIKNPKLWPAIPLNL